LKSEIECGASQSVGDARFDMLYRQIQLLGKKFDFDCSQDFSSAATASAEGDFKFAKPTLDHVAKPTSSDMNNTNRVAPKVKKQPPKSVFITPDILESPMSSAFGGGTPDDKLKDPDWAKTPIKIKRQSNRSFAATKKVTKSKSSKSNLLDIADANDDE
jgi:hypothetical protein